MTQFYNFASADNLLEVFQLALQNDPQLKAAQAERSSANEYDAQTLAKLFPTVSIHSNIAKSSQDLRSREGLTNDSDELKLSIFTEFSLALSLKQPLFNLPNLRNRKISVIQSVQAELHYRIAQEQLLFRVVEAYFNVLSSLEDLSFARAEKNAIARQLARTKSRFKVGLIAVTDVHESQARHDLAIAQEIKAESQLADQRESLRVITGKLHNSLWALTEDTPLIPPTPSNLNDWIEAARGQNLQIAAIKMQADILKQKINVSRAEYYPTLDVNASYGFYEYGGAYGQRSLDGSISLDLNMIIFEGNILASKIRQKTHDFEKLIQEIDQKEREVLQTTRSAYLGVLAGMSYVKALKQTLSSSNQALAATNAGFEVGSRSAIDVLNAQREMFRSQRDYAHARYSYILDMLKLKVAVGLLSIDDLEQINNWLR